MKLNLGCGRSPLEGWTNVDSNPVAPHIIKADLNELHRLSWNHDSCEEFMLSHVLEHIAEPLRLMETLWLLAQPDAVATVRVPYGSSDDADEDPTHVRRYFLGSWGYFGQPHYWRADYGYRGDWECRQVTLFMREDVPPMNHDEAAAVILGQRNVVKEMVATLHARKPAREAKAELQTKAEILVMFPGTSFSSPPAGEGTSNV